MICKVRIVELDHVCKNTEGHVLGHLDDVSCRPTSTIVFPAEQVLNLDDLQCKGEREMVVVPALAVERCYAPTWPHPGLAPFRGGLLVEVRVPEKAPETRTCEPVGFGCKQGLHDFVPFGPQPLHLQGVLYCRRCGVRRDT